VSRLLRVRQSASLACRARAQRHARAELSGRPPPRGPRPSSCPRHHLAPHRGDTP
jgi:hypothetical protein